MHATTQFWRKTESTAADSEPDSRSSLKERLVLHAHRMTGQQMPPKFRLISFLAPSGETGRIKLRCVVCLCTVCLSQARVATDYLFIVSDLRPVYSAIRSTSAHRARPVSDSRFRTGSGIQFPVRRDGQMCTCSEPRSPQLCQTTTESISLALEKNFDTIFAFGY